MSLDVCASRGLCLSLGSPTEQGIRIIKLFAWEKDFVSKIDKSRHDEMRSLRGYMVSFSHDVFLVVCGLFELLPAYIRLFVPDFFSFFFFFRRLMFVFVFLWTEGRRTVGRNVL